MKKKNATLVNICQFSHWQLMGWIPFLHQFCHKDLIPILYVLRLILGLMVAWQSMNVLTEAASDFPIFFF